MPTLRDIEVRKFFKVLKTGPVVQFKNLHCTSGTVLGTLHSLTFYYHTNSAK